MKTLMLCGALFATAAPAAAGVHAVNGNPEYLQTTVTSADLDLTRPAGADVMIARIRRAAGSVCGEKPFLEMGMPRHTRVCISTAMNAALMQLNAPLVTARFANKAPPAQLAAVRSMEASQ